MFDAVPPGVDELVALAKVVSLARRDEYGVHFDRVVVDTAPTGHTLRLLSFPEFLDRFITRLLALRGRLGGAAAAPAARRASSAGSSTRRRAKWRVSAAPAARTT